MTPYPPRPPHREPRMTRTQWLHRLPDPDDMLGVLDLADHYASTAGTLNRLALAASPWAMWLPYRVWVGSYGLLWCLESSRVHPDDARTIRRLDARGLCRLVADIGTGCPRPDDVPIYLTARALGRCA